MKKGLIPRTNHIIVRYPKIARLLLKNVCLVFVYFFIKYTIEDEERLIFIDFLL